MTMISISIDENPEILVKAEPSTTIGNLINSIPSLRGLKDLVVFYEFKIISNDKTIEELGIKDGAKLGVFTRNFKHRFEQSKTLSERIQDIAVEAVRIIDFKIERSLSDPKVMSVCNSYINSQMDNKNNENQINEVTEIPAQEIKSSITTEPLPMEWRSDEQNDFYAEPQEPIFHSISEARKYYSSQLSDYGWGL
jgi:hypothetical protein